MSPIDAPQASRPESSNEAVGGQTTSPNRETVIQTRRDREATRWVEQLQVGHPRRDQTVAALHKILLRVAFHELTQRRYQLQSIDGPELDDLAHQAADDALMRILERLDGFEGRSRFTTWAYTFVVFQVSAKLAHHAWQRQPPCRWALAFEQLPDPLVLSPGDRLEEQEQLKTLATAIGALPERQHQVFVAAALNDVPIDVLAIQLASNRNAVYKNLFDARRSLRARLAFAGHAVCDSDAV